MPLISHIGRGSEVSMNCYYCDQITESAPDYEASEARYDLASTAPRCERHWRFVCARCGDPSHFMAIAYCDHTRRFFCARCAQGAREVTGDFWAWKYHFEYQSPWTGEWRPSLDRLERDGQHPLLMPERAGEGRDAISRETPLVRYPRRRDQWRPEGDFSDDEVRANWNRNADRWTATYADDGDPNRRFQSDPPMLELLGDVNGLDVLDVGSGNGYLSRKLARAGARVTGVELSDRFLAQANEAQKHEHLAIRYIAGSASDMDFLDGASFDRAVSNYVLMDIVDYEAALREVHRVLRPGGHFIVVISHPCFALGYGWSRPILDSPRQEETEGWLTDNYFHRGPYMGTWGNLDPVLSFHRPLRDYWEAFSKAGFAVTGFDEPGLADRGRRELSLSRQMKSLRVPYSCIFRLGKPS